MGLRLLQNDNGSLKLCRHDYSVDIQLSVLKVNGYTFRGNNSVPL